MYPRLLSLPDRSFFLFGPRGTGKSVWLRQVLPRTDLSIDLLKSRQYLEYKRDPGLLARQAASLSGRKVWIVVDEVQKLPELLDEVHALLFEGADRYRFALSGSSARKLKRSEANMLAGRAVSRKMFPLSMLETGEDFSLHHALSYGQLPMSVTSVSEVDKADYLDAYVETYLREEIQQEAFTRNLDSFYRFLTVAALFNGQTVNLSNVARETGVARSTVQGYFSILDDTLLGWQLPAYRKRVKVKEVAHSKFYLFDCGVQRALVGSHRDRPSAIEQGNLFETFILNEFRALNAWYSHGGRFYYWRTPSGTEVDLIWKRGARAAGFEIKSSANWRSQYNTGLNTLLEAGEIQRAFGIYLGARRQRSGSVEVLPYAEAIEMAASNGFLREADGRQGTLL